MLHRRVYETIGGYDGAFPMCNDFDYWLRAARMFRFRHVAGGPADPVPPPRRELLRRVAPGPGAERGRGRAAQEPRRLAARRPRARARLGRAPAAVGRAPRMPRPRRRVRRPRPARARRRSGAPAPTSEPRAPWRAGRHASGQRIVLSSFGFADAGGGTIVPRYVAKELAQRGHEVTVFAAGVARLDGEPPYALRSVGRGRRRGRVGAQPTARAARPGPSPSRARRSADPDGVRRGPRPRRGPTSCTSTTCTTSGSRWSTRRSRGASARSSRPTTTGSDAHATTCSATTSRCATAPATPGVRAQPASARATPPATPSAGASCANGSRCASTASSRCRRRCGAP